MTKKRNLTFDEVLSFIESLPYNQFKEVIEHYSTHTKADFEKELDVMVSLNFQRRLKKLNINTNCPNCNGSSIVKFGKQGNINRFKCKDCGKTFTLFSGTILEALGCLD